MMQRMVIHMNDGQLRTLAQLQAFLDGTMAVDFAVAAEERYRFIGRTVRRFSYRRLRRAQKTVVLRFLERVSGYSRQQLTRLAHQFLEPVHACRCAAARAYRFAARYAFRAGHQEAHGAGGEAVWRCALRAARGNFGGAPVQPEKAPGLSAPAGGVDQDAPRHDPDRHPARAGTERPARLFASR